MTVRSPEYRFVNDMGFQDQTILCPWCETHAGVECVSKVGIAPGVKYGEHLYGNLHVGKCRSCQYPFFGLHMKNGKDSGHYKYLYPREVYAPKCPSEANEDVVKIYKEACEIVHISPMAAAVLARRCVQQLLRQELGIKAKTLWHEIKVAITKQELSLQTRQMLDYVRHVGNWSAHPKFIEGGEQREGAAENEGTDEAMRSVEQSSLSEDPGVTIYDTSSEEAVATLKVVENMLEDLFARPAESEELWAKLKKINPELPK